MPISSEMSCRVFAFSLEMLDMLEYLQIEGVLNLFSMLPFS